METRVPDFSIKAVNTSITNLIAKAGTDGLRAEEIVKQLGYEAKSDIGPRLRDLKGRGIIKEVQGGVWKKVLEKCTEEMPEIALPGSEKFVSYKNTLQEYCQKRGLPVPNYTPNKKGHGYIGKVAFSDTMICSTVVCTESKDADAHVAFEALQQIGYLKEITYEQSIKILKRKSSEIALVSSLAKQTKVENKELNTTCKSILNEYAQKNQLAQPVYETSPVVQGGFLSIVTFAEKKYESLTVCMKRKDAEQRAAEVALNRLGIYVPKNQTDNKTDIVIDEVSKMVAEAREEASNPGRYKSLLQELCVKAGKGHPSYNTKENQHDKTFISTVTIQNIDYIGPAASRKKFAEGKAAFEALNKLKSA